MTTGSRSYWIELLILLGFISAVPACVIASMHGQIGRAAFHATIAAIEAVYLFGRPRQ